MKKPPLIPSFLLAGLLIMRPHCSGVAYPFMEGFFLLPVLLALSLVLMAPASGRFPSIWGFPLIMAFPWLLSGWSFVSLLWSSDPGRGTVVSFSLLLGAAAFTLAFLFASDRREEDWGGAFFLSLLLLPVLARALYQRFFGLTRLRGALEKMLAEGEHVGELLGVISKGRVFGSFLNSNMLAGFLAVFIPVTLDLSLTAPDRGRRVVFSLLTIGQFGVLMLTGSFGGSLAAAMAAAFVFIVRRGIRRRELLWAGAAGVLLVAGLVMVRGFSFSPGPDNSFTQRVGYMKAGFSMAAEKPLLGWGAGSTPGVLMGYVAPGIRPVADPHNFLVRSWIAWGLPGVAILISFLFLWAKKVLAPAVGKGWRSMSAGYAGLFAGSLAFLLHSLMDMGFFVPETALFGWAVMGGSLGLAAKVQKRQGLVGEGTSGRRLRWLAGGTALALVIPSLIFSQGEFTAFKGYRAMESGRLEDAARMYREARRLLPFNGHFTLEEGRAKKALGETEEAQALFSKASRQLRFSPYPSWEMGRLALAEEAWEGSIPHLEKALQRYPTSPRIHLDLAQAYYGMGDNEAAVRLLEEARRYSVFDEEVRSFFQ